MQKLSFDITQWNRLFPFFFILDEEMKLVSFGKSLVKIVSIEEGQLFEKLFEIKCPIIRPINFSELKARHEEVFLLGALPAERKILLSGQFEFLPETNQLLFLGSPWFSTLEEFDANKLLPEDFARHDASMNLLNVLQTKTKEKSLANMSHEIRTPMNGILGVANLLAKTPLAAQQKKYLQLIKESANNLLVIVNDLMDIENTSDGENEFAGASSDFQMPHTDGDKNLLDSEEKTPDEYKLLGAKKILIAEDIELNQFIASQILESWGMEVTVVNNGKEALEIIQEKTFDLILMDIQMPEMDGVEATQLIRKLDNPILSAIPIIALTANALKGDHVRYIQAGMNDYVAKPYTEAELYSAISKCFTPAEKTNQAENTTTKNLQPVAVLKEQQTSILNEGTVFSKETAETKLYDLTMVNLIGKGKPEFLNKMVSLFLEQIPNDLSKMNESASKKEWDAVSKLAHRMKPSIDGMGIALLKDKIRELECVAGKNDGLFNETELLQMINTVTHVMEQVFSQLRKAFPELSKPI